jgi:hypothetical protein
MCSFQPSLVRHWWDSRCTKGVSDERSAVDVHWLREPLRQEGRSSELLLLSVLLRSCAEVAAASWLKLLLLLSTSSTPEQAPTLEF